MAVTATVAIVAGTGYSIERGQSAAREQRRAARSEREARRVSSAQQENERRAAIRKQIREERVRQAQIRSAAQVAGVEGGSVVSSTIGSGQTLASQGQAFATGASLASQRQTQFLQQGADYRSAAAFDQAQGQIGSAVAGLGTAAFATGLATF